MNPHPLPTPSALPPSAPTRAEGGVPAGRLWLVPNALDFGLELHSLADALPLGVISLAAQLGHWVAENAKTTRAFLKRVDAVAPLARPLQAVQIAELPRPPKGRAPSPQTDASSLAALRAMLSPALAGHDIGLLSEAGLPAVADPGAALVQAAHDMGVAVHALPGASAITLALAASGMNGQQFAFHGYLPVQADERAARIRALEATSRQLGQTQVVIETPYRNQALLGTLLSSLRPATRLAVAAAVGLPAGRVRSAPVSVWRQGPSTAAWPDDRTPAVFLWLA